MGDCDNDCSVCSKCNTQEEVNECNECGVYLCIDCDKGEMGSSPTDGSTYCNDCMPKCEEKPMCEEEEPTITIPKGDYDILIEIRDQFDKTTYRYCPRCECLEAEQTPHTKPKVEEDCEKCEFCCLDYTECECKGSVLE